MNTVVVQLTSRGVGAIAVVMVAGPEAARVVAGFSRSRRAGTMRPGDILHTNLVDPASGNEPPVVLDDALVVCTQGDRYELHLHGGTAVVESVLAALQAAGVAIISAEEAGARGLFGEPQSLRAELALMLPCAQTMTAVRLLGRAGGLRGLYAMGKNVAATGLDWRHAIGIGRFRSGRAWRMWRLSFRRHNGYLMRSQRFSPIAGPAADCDYWPAQCGQEHAGQCLVGPADVDHLGYRGDDARLGRIARAVFLAPFAQRAAD